MFTVDLLLVYVNLLLVYHCDACFSCYLFESQFLILGVDTVLGSDGKIHKRGYGVVFNYHTFNLLELPYTCLMCCAGMPIQWSNKYLCQILDHLM